MSNNIYHKRNANAGIAPTASQLTVGEIALNTADGKAYTRTTAGTVVELTEPSVADGGEQFTPLNISNLAMWLDAADTSTLYQNPTGNLSAVSSPLDIANCAAWYDASDSSTLFAANTGSTLATTTVGRWANKSGGAEDRDLRQSDSTARPVITSNVFGSMPAVVFDGVNDFLNQSFTLGFPNTVFIVFQYSSAYSATTTLLDGASGGNTLRLAPFSNTEFLFNTGAVSPQITANLNTLPITQLQIISAVAAGPNSGVWRNNLPAGGNTTTGTTTAPAGLTLCAWGAAGVRGQFANVSIAEVIVYSAQLSTAQRTRVEKYLANKWSVTAPALTAATTAVTAAGDPIGYWGDKSGNNRYATQQTNANRPTRGTINGRAAISFNAANQVGLTTDINETGLGDSIGPYTVVVIANSTAAETNRVLMGSQATGNYDIGLYYNSNNGPNAFVSLYTLAGSRTHNNGNVVPLNPAVFSFAVQRHTSVAANSTFSTWQNGARVQSLTSLGTLPSGTLRRLLETIGSSRTSSGTYDGVMTGNICEILVYTQALTDAQLVSIAQYANTKWGATAVSFPRVSNADAQDWINRVYTNGGAVTASTAAAVNTFCNAIDAAGIRDRFYRLNLFCGTGLQACLTPLYRGPSLSGTQYGNTTDTNNNFLSTDYNERGSAGGLTSNGTSKYLNTGFKADTPGQTDRHLSMVGINTGATTSKYFLGMDNSGCGDSAFWGILTGSPNLAQIMVRAQAIATNSATFSPGAGYIVLSGNGSASAYVDGVFTQTGFAGAYTAPNLDIYVHALNRCGTTIDYTAARLKSYSIGGAMTAGQVTSFYNALLAFNTVLNRA